MNMNLAGQWEYLPDPQGTLSPHQLPSDGWKEMRIPNNWQLGGLDNYSGAVWFRRRFSFTPNPGKHVWLKFLGVDYFAQVWLNGVYLGEHEGYFQPFEFDVTAAIKEGENELLIRVDSPMELPGEVWPDKKRLIKGVLNHHDCRPGGWDPEHGQDMNTGGVWNDVLIYESEAIRIGPIIKITPTLLGDGSAVLTVDANVENYQGSPERASLKVEIHPDNFSGEALAREWEVVFSPGKTEVKRALYMKNPKLWWTWDHGAQNLYRATVTLSQKGRVLDKRSVRFGIRELIVDKEHGWKLNGKRFFPRGTNVIPAQWLSEYNESKIEKDIELLRHANVNAVRVHAHVTRPEFYDACDEAGILVWQDFPLQWSYEESEEFYNEAARQLREMIEILYNHPSIGVWCCHNEPSVNTHMLDNFLYQVAKETDGSRYVEHHSDFRDHPYPGWYYGHWSLFLSAPGAPFVNEFGAQALPNLESMRKMLPAEKLWPPDWGVWEYHDFQYDQTFGVAQIDMGKSLEDFINNSQKYQYLLLKCAIESYRRDKRMTGIFQFMFMDPWPAITWSVVDYWRKPKLGYKALQIGFQPVLISFVVGRDRYVEGARNALLIHDIVVINDLDKEFFDAELHLWLQDEQGNILLEERQSVDIPPYSRNNITTPMLQSGKWKLTQTFTAGQYVLYGEIRHPGEVIARNEETFIVFRKEDQDA